MDKKIHVFKIFLIQGCVFPTLLFFLFFFVDLWIFFLVSVVCFQLSIIILSIL
jgi:hypothetical protein